MNQVYRLVWNRRRGMYVPADELAGTGGKSAAGKFGVKRRKRTGLLGRPQLASAIAFACALSPLASHATTFLNFSGGLSGWTTRGTVSVLSSTDAFNLGGNAFSLTPASGQSMAKITPSGSASSVDATLGLSANAIENFLNNSNGHVTNFGVLTKTYTFNPGTYTFAWAYAARDYVPYNDGVMFSLTGGGSQTLVSLARNGSNAGDISGPSPGTLILGSYGSTPWETASFTITTAGSYQLGFAAYNWNDTGLNPSFYVSGVAGTFTGTPPVFSGGGASTVIDSTGGNVSASVYDTSSTAYSQPSLTFDGGTLQYTANTTTSVDAALNSGGGTIDTNGNAVSYSGVISSSGALTKIGSGTLTLSGANTYNGATTISAGTLALSGSGSVAASSSVTDNGIFDISAATSGASIQTLAGTGAVNLGDKTLTFTNAASAFSGVIGGTGGVSIAGGNETLSGVNTYSGATSIANGSSLTLTGSGSIANSNLITNDGTLDITGTSAGAALTSLAGSGTVLLGSNALTLTNASSAFGGVIGGSGSLVIDGGNQTLSNLNTYSGATTIGGSGVLKLAGAGNIAASSGVIDNGNFDISAVTTNASVKTLAGNGTVSLGSKTLILTDAAGEFAGVIDGEGALNIAGGSQTLSNVNTYSGATLIDAGASLSLSGAGSIAQSGGIIDNGTLDITGAAAGASLKTLAGNGAVILGDKTLTLTAASDNFSGAIDGTGGLTLANGSETLSDANTYSGVTSIAGGSSLLIAGSGSIASSSGVVDEGSFDISGVTDGVAITQLSGGGTVNLGAKTLTLTQADGTFSGVIAGAGALNITGGIQTLTGANTYSGGTNLSNSKVIIASDGALGDAASVVTFNNAVLQNTASVTMTRNMSLLGNASFDTDADTALKLSGSISGGGHVFKQGDGTLILDGDNRNWGTPGDNSVGGLTIDAGLVEVTHPYGLGYGLITLNNGAINTQVNILTGQTIGITGHSVVNTQTGTTTTLTGTVESLGAGSCFLKTGSGTLVMSGAASLSNGTCVAEGKLVTNGALRSSVTVDSGASLRGVGTIIGTVTIQGTLAPGNSPGTLTANGTVTMAAGSVFQADINGTAIGIGPGNYSRLVIAGAGNQFVIAQGATLSPNLVNITGATTYVPYVPALGDSFRIVTAEGGIVGRFATFTQPAGLADDTRMAIFYNVFDNHSIDLRVVPASYANYLQPSNRNAQSTGKALDQILSIDQNGAANATQDELAYTVAGLNAANLSSVATALAGEVHGALAAIAPQADQWLQDAVSRQLIAASDAARPMRGLWMDSNANRGKWSADAAASEFIARRSQLVGGYGWSLSEQSRVGVGFSNSTGDVDAPAGSGSVAENIGFVYGQYSFEEILVDGLAGYGASHWKTRRADPLNPATELETHSSGGNSMVKLGAQLPFEAGKLAFSPYTRVAWQRSTRDAFDERISSPNALAALYSPNYSASGTRVSAGISGGTAGQNPLAAAYTYLLNIGVAHDSGDLVHPVVQASLAGSTMEIVAPQVGRTALQTTLTGTARIDKSAYAYMGLSGEARSGKSEEAGIHAGVWASF